MYKEHIFNLMNGCLDFYDIVILSNILQNKIIHHEEFNDIRFYLINLPIKFTLKNMATTIKR